MKCFQNFGEILSYDYSIKVKGYKGKMVTAAAYSNGTLLVKNHKGNTLYRRKIDINQENKHIQENNDKHIHLMFSYDGRKLIFDFLECTSYINTSDWIVANEVQHNATENHVSIFSQNGKMFTTMINDKTYAFTDATNNTYLIKGEDMIQGDLVKSISMSKNNKHIAFCSQSREGDVLSILDVNKYKNYIEEKKIIDPIDEKIDELDREAIKTGSRTEYDSSFPIFDDLRQFMLDVIKPYLILSWSCSRIDIPDGYEAYEYDCCYKDNKVLIATNIRNDLHTKVIVKTWCYNNKRININYETTINSIDLPKPKFSQDGEYLLILNDYNVTIYDTKKWNSKTISLDKEQIRDYFISSSNDNLVIIHKGHNDVKLYPIRS